MTPPTWELRKFFQVLCGPLQIFPSAVRPVANFSKCCAARCKFFQVPSAVRPVANFSKCCAARCKFFQVLCGPLQIFPSAVRPVANFSKCCAARCKFFQVLCGPLQKKKIFDSMSAKKPSFLQRFRRFKTTTLLQMRLSITKPRSARRLIANETQSQEGQAIANETQSQ
jgi:hypothetical protein